MRQLEETLHLLAGQDPPVDTAELIDAIEQDLTGEGVPVFAVDGSLIMQTQAKPSERTQRRPARRTWAFAAAIVATGMAIGIPVWLLGGDDPEDVVSAPAAVFGMRTDNFCEWFTAEEMNEIVATAQQRTGTAYVLEEFTAEGCDSSPWDSQWNPADLEPKGKSHRWSTQGWLQNQGSSTLGVRRVAVQIEPVDREEGNPLAWRPLAFQVKSAPFVEHHLLDSGVSYQRLTYQFHWGDGWDGFLKVDGHPDEILYFGLSVDDHDSVVNWTPEYEELALAVVNELLRQMNWIDTQEG